MAGSCWAAIVLSAITGIIFGVVPALVAFGRPDRQQADRRSACSSGSVRARRLDPRWSSPSWRLSLVLLAGAALLIVSSTKLVNVSPAFSRRSS